jgi:hypothetical protein
VGSISDAANATTNFFMSVLLQDAPLAKFLTWFAASGRVTTR